MIGIAGTLIVFFGLPRHANATCKFRRLAHPVLNLLGASLIGFSLTRNFNLASAPMETFWIAISLPGIFKGTCVAADKDTDAAIARSGSES